jgi:hypothetical protein
MEGSGDGNENRGDDDQNNGNKGLRTGLQGHEFEGTDSVPGVNGSRQLQ